MTPRRRALDVVYGKAFERRLRELPQERKASCLRVITALAAGLPTPGMRVKPIQPSKRYSEARIASGDRLVFRVEEGALVLIDVVSDDDIARYSE